MEDHPILALKSAEATVVADFKADAHAIAADLAAALKDITPSHWDVGHVASDIYAKAKAAIAKFEAYVESKI